MVFALANVMRWIQTRKRFNQFADFLLLGGKGMIAENVRDEQRKVFTESASAFVVTIPV